MKKYIFKFLIISITLIACEKKSKGEKLLEGIKEDTKEAVEDTREEVEDSKDDADEGVKKSEKKLKKLFK